eukprot:5560148-Prymnesium_polylepis.1
MEPFAGLHAPPPVPSTTTEAMMHDPCRCDVAGGRNKLVAYRSNKKNTVIALIAENFGGVTQTVTALLRRTCADTTDSDSCGGNVVT